MSLALTSPLRCRHEVQHVDEPNLLRETFPYTQVPRVEFDGVSVPMELPEEVFITDTTFRDGQQARPPYTAEQIVDLFDLLHRLSGPKGIVRQCEFFLYSEKDRKAVEMCKERSYRYPEVTGWIRAVAADFELVKQMGLKETGILTSASDYHIFLKLKKTREQALEDYLGLVKKALEAGVKPRCHFEDATRADIHGFIVPFAQRLMDLADESKVPIRIRLCDTMGYGIPYPEAALPRSVPKLVHTLVHEAGVPPLQLEWHGHNDFHKVHVNTVTAWMYCCAAANGTLMSTGERTGNSPVEALCVEYACLFGPDHGMDLSVITDIADYYRKNVGLDIPSNYPFQGSNFNVTAAGIHADGLIKNPEIYNVFDTEAILGRPYGVMVTDKSGLAGVAFWVNRRLRLTGDRQIPKNHPGVQKIAEWVEEQYTHLRTTSISDDEMETQARKHLPELFTK